MEAVDSTYGCVLLRGQILTATKNWWGLHPDETVLITNYLLSEIPAVLKDTPVFLPVKSPTVSLYFTLSHFQKYTMLFLHALQMFADIIKSYVLRSLEIVGTSL